MSQSVFTDSTLPALPDEGATQPSPGATDPTGAPARRGIPTWAVALVVLLVLVLAAVALTALRPGGPTTAPLHPDNPRANGAQAVARVLASQGVRVEVVAGQDALRRARIDSDTTVVVSYGVDLQEPTILELRRLVAGAERLVLVEPERRVLRGVAPGISMVDRQRDAAALVSTCDTPDVRPGEQLGRSQSEYSVTGARESCFVTSGYAVYLRTTTPYVKDLVVIGSVDVLRNDRVLEYANGTVALRALGHSPRLVWYVPDLKDVPVGTTTRPDEVTPVWWTPALLLLLFATFGLFWWRGRRFGRLVVEPLPVIVRTVETTESRGRMYRKAGDTGRAAAVLRDATRRRVAAYLGAGLGASSEPRALIDAVTEATRRRPEDIGELLYGRTPQTEAELLSLAAALTALEKEIRR